MRCRRLSTFGALRSATRTWRLHLAAAYIQWQALFKSWQIIVTYCAIQIVREENILASTMFLSLRE
jgi:hypothetical protein